MPLLHGGVEEIKFPRMIKSLFFFIVGGLEQHLVLIWLSASPVDSGNGVCIYRVRSAELLCIGCCMCQAFTLQTDVIAT